MSNPYGGPPARQPYPQQPSAGPPQYGPPGQPQYYGPPGQYGPPGPPQFQPPPPRPRRTGLVVLGIVGAVVLVGGAIFGVNRVLSSSSDDTSAQPVAPSTAPPARPTSQPTEERPSIAPTSAPAAGPVYCEGSSGFRCFPKATVASVSAILKSKGATCKHDDSADRVKCVKGGKAESIDVSLGSPPGDARKLMSVGVLTFSNAAGANAKGRALVVSNLRASMPTLMSAALPGETKTQQQITRWLPKDMERCTAQGVRVGGYTVRCEPPTRFTVSDKSGRQYSSWSAGLTISSY